MKVPYELIDSGEGERLERFGDRVLIRPSKFSVWKRRTPAAWQSAHASYQHKGGWRFRGNRFEEWTMECGEYSLVLRLQDNGQVGIFPEHQGYLERLSGAIKKHALSKGRSAKVLNLFAYTGMASIVALKAGAEVTHVDLSKKVLEWAQKNFALNGGLSARMIREDALQFVEREIRREKNYDVVIADPPSFSRISDREEWELEGILGNLISILVKVLDPISGTLVMTSHHFESGGHVMANLIHDQLPVHRSAEVTTGELTLTESSSPRILPAGFLVWADIQGS